VLVEAVHELSASITPKLVRERHGVMCMANPRPASTRILSSVSWWFIGTATTTNYLLLRAYNYWDFPKGVVEVDESPLQAAIREVEEETTLTGLRFAGAMFTARPIPIIRVARWRAITSPNPRRPRSGYQQSRTWPTGA